MGGPDGETQGRGAGTFAVVPLAKMDQPYIGKDVSRVEGFAPAGVSQNDIGGKTATFEFEQQSSHGLPVKDCCFHLTQIRVLVLFGRTVQGVLEPFDTRMPGAVSRPIPTTSQPCVCDHDSAMWRNWPGKFR